MKKLQITVTSFLVMIILVASSGCKPITPNNSGSSELNGKILITGSTSFLDLMDALGESFTETHMKVSIDVQAGGSSVGIKDSMNKLNDIGMSSRELKTDGSEEGLNATVIAVEAIAVIVNAKNPIQNLSKDQITSIFKGDIKNWKDVGGTNAAITVFNRESSSGTRGAFGELMKIEKSGTGGYNYFTKSAVTLDSTGKILSGVSADENAIGYIGLGSVDSSVRALSIDNITPDLANIKADKYILKRPLLLLTNKSVQNQLVKEFIDYVTSSNGEKIVGEYKLIRPSDLG